MCYGIPIFGWSPTKFRQHPDITKAVQLTGTQRNIQKQHAPHVEVPLSVCNKFLGCAVLCFTSSSLMRIANLAHVIYRDFSAVNIKQL